MKLALDKPIINMLLIQQLANALHSTRESVANLCANIKDLFVKDAENRSALCNHADAIKALQNDIALLKIEVDEIVIPDPVDVQPLLESVTSVTIDASEQIVLLPLGAVVKSILMQNTSVTPTEEVGYACHSITTDASNTIVTVQFNGVTNLDTFNLIINYVIID